MKKTSPKVMTERARKLRRDSTPAERIMWRLLRDRRLQGWKFRRQHPLVVISWIFIVMKSDWQLNLTVATMRKKTRRVMMIAGIWFSPVRESILCVFGMWKWKPIKVLYWKGSLAV